MPDVFRRSFDYWRRRPPWIGTKSAVADGIITLQPIDAAASLPNLTLTSPALLTLGAISGAATLPNVLLRSPALLTLQAINAFGGPENIVISTPFVAGAPDAPAQATISGQPVVHSTRLDPLLMFRPEGRPLRVIREAQRIVERRLRE